MVGRAVGVLVATVTMVATGLVPMAGATPTPASAPAAASVAAAPATFTPVATTRLLDTATGVGAPVGPVAAGRTIALQVAGRGGIPATGVGAVALTVTGRSATTATAVTVFPTGRTRPSVASLQLPARDAVSNLVVVPLGSGGRVSLHNLSGSAHLSADVSGWYTAGGGYNPVTPTRVADTRTGLNVPQAKVGPGGSLDVFVTDRAGVPLGSSIAAVMLNITGYAATAATQVTAYPYPASAPATASLSLSAGAARSALVQVPVASGRRVTLRNRAGTVDLAVDMVGWFDPSGRYTTVKPVRVLDTASGLGAPATAIPAGGDLTLAVPRSAGAPSTGVGAWALTMTARSATASGALSLRPAGTSAAGVPATLPFSAGRAASQLMLVRAGTGGRVVIRNSSPGPVQVTADLTGFSLIPTAVAWSAPEVVFPPQGSPQALACPTATRCLAVDGTGNVVTFDGTTWSRPTRINAVQLVGISCPSTAFCLAVDPTGYLTFNGTTWSARRSVPGVTALDDVSCATPTFCVATDLAGLATRFDGTTWSTPVQVTTSVRSHLPISCPATTFCLIADSSGQGYRFDGATWRATAPSGLAGDTDYTVACASPSFCAVAGAHAATFDGTAWGPASFLASPEVTTLACGGVGRCVAMEAGGRVFSLEGGSWTQSAYVGLTGATGLSCPNADVCLAVDRDGLFSKLSGGAWSTPVPFDPNVSGSQSTVSCANATFCVSLDDTGFARTFNGSTWSAPVATNATNAGRSGLSCTSPTFCLAVANRTVSVFDGTSWVSQVRVGVGNLTSVSCTGPTFCVALNNVDSAYIFNGSTWSAGTSIDPGTNGLLSVSCVDPAFCIAVDGSGNALRFNGTTWSAPVAIDPPRGLFSVSCASRTFCVAVGDGNALQFNGTRWTAPQLIDELGSLISVSCPRGASQTCVALDVGSGSAFTLRGGVWSAPTPINGWFALVDVSCPTTTLCVAVDREGRAQLLT